MEEKIEGCNTKHLLCYWQIILFRTDYFSVMISLKELDCKHNLESEHMRKGKNNSSDGGGDSGWGVWHIMGLAARAMSPAGAHSGHWGITIFAFGS